MPADRKDQLPTIACRDEQHQQRTRVLARRCVLNIERLAAKEVAVLVFVRHALRGTRRIVEGPRVHLGANVQEVILRREVVVVRLRQRVKELQSNSDSKMDPSIHTRAPKHAFAR